MMTLDDFRNSFADKTPPSGLSPELIALWHDGSGNWGTAHQLAQYEPGSDMARIHAYLHRKEGDTTNANYWYKKAGIAQHNGSLKEEFNKIAEYLLNKGSHCSLDF
ncbi:MAG: hypothetical protein U9N85_09360 [Bacteroidota bacterium]|nr:hypothetical protein [Bacteroidota bacterium]